ncbi:hypothetical protein HPB49_004258 [Dermacentor silvarum]|uniref:Uncharacterized protein n=1 Tax=Dermacentor silvarum TaxID=543639 RepID=A0ACB8DUJ9_DERSI|nr:hypothetical protein HPB49_004258 [Dermacentor silvarum]
MAMRKQKPLSIKDKPNILAAVDWNPKRKRIDIANELGLPASWSSSWGAGGALLKWFKQVQISGVNFDGSVLKEKALEVADLGIDDFTAYNGWISRFRARHGIAYRQTGGIPYERNPQLLVLDSFRGHLTAKMKQGLRRSAPPLLQPLDVGVNKPFKDLLRREYE